MSAAELDNASVEAEVIDPASTPAILLGCQRCQTSTLLRPGGLCATCIAEIGLADDRTEYTRWREKVSDEVAAGPGAG